MTNEEMEKTIQFILAQQAQFAANLGALAASQKELTDSQKELAQAQQRTEQRWERAEEGIRSLLAIAEIHDREIATLAETQAQFAESQKETNDRLNALIDTVERYISEGRNGKA